MKKKILSLLTLILISGVSLASCDLPEDEEKDDDGSETVVSEFSVTINNLASYYLPSASISWEDVSLTLTYKDTSRGSLTLTKGAFDKEELGEEDEFILYTSGLYTLSSIEGEDIPEGNYPISYYLTIDEEEYSGDLFTIIITTDPSAFYTVMDFSEPSFAITYKNNLERVSSEGGSENEDKFFTSPTYYEVGDDNPFIYKPSLILWNKSSMLPETPTSFSVSVSVTHLLEDETEEELVLDSNEYVSYSSFSFSFTKEAIGEVFTLSMSLTDFKEDINGNALPTYSFTIKVEDGYNVYDAIDLGRMSLFDEEKHVSSSSEDEMVNTLDDSELLTPTSFEYGESYYNIFFDYDEQGEPTYVHKSYPEIWKDFYAEKGVEDTTEVNGLFIHSDLVITEDDLPDDFKISEEEAVTMGGQGYNYPDMIGSIRDGVIIYNHLMDQDDFTLNGNLFQIDASGLKWNLTRVKTGSADRNGDIEGTALEFYAEAAAELTVSEGTATLFAFDGYKMEWENTNAGTILEPNATAYLVNLETSGNMEGNGNSYTDEAMIGQLASGTLTFCKSVCAQTVVENVITKHYLTAYYAEKTTSSWTCLNVSHAKIYDCYGVAFVIYVSGDNQVNNSEIKRFGGPVALMFCAEDEEGYFKGYNYAGFTMGENVVAETPLAGDEAWFQIYGLTSYLSLFSGFDAFFSGGDGLGAAIDDLIPSLGGLASSYFKCTDYGKTMLDEDGKFNLLSFGMERHTTGTDLYIDFGFGDASGDNSARINADCDTTSMETTDYSKFEYISTLFYKDSSLSNINVNIIIATISVPLPIFMTNTGKIFAPSFSGNILTGFTGTLIDIGDYYSQVASGTTSPTTKEITLDSDDTSVFMYYPLDLTSMSVDFNITFAMAMSLYDKPSEA